MRKLSALVAFIIQDLNYVAAENIESFHVFEEYSPVGEYVSNEYGQAVCIYDCVYNAVIRIEGFPAKRYSAQLVFARVASWVLDNDPAHCRKSIQRDGDNALVDLPMIDINDEPESDETLAIELIVPFREPVFIVEEQDGLIEYCGRMYRLADEAEPREQFEQNYILNRA